MSFGYKLKQFFTSYQGLLALIIMFELAIVLFLSTFSAPVVEIFGVFAYDFTNNLSKAYLDGHKSLGGGMYGMIGGDNDANGTVNIDDLDLNWATEAGKEGYDQSDLNLDSQINNPDKNDIWEPNQTLSTQVPN